MSTQSGKENTEPDNVNVGLIATVAIVGALFTIAIAAALTALVRSETDRHATEEGTIANLGSVQRLKDEQHAKLEGAPGWSNRATGHVSVPIDRAMQLVAADIQKNPYLATPLPPKPKTEPDAGAAAVADGGASAPTGSAAPAGSTGALAPAAPAPAAPAAPARVAAPVGQAPAAPAPVAPKAPAAPAPSAGTP